MGDLYQVFHNSFRTFKSFSASLNMDLMSLSLSNNYMKSMITNTICTILSSRFVFHKHILYVLLFHLVKYFFSRLDHAIHTLVNIREYLLKLLLVASLFMEYPCCSLDFFLQPLQSKVIIVFIWAYSDTNFGMN